MYYLVDNSLNIIFGWSYKCGCMHIKNIFFNLQEFSENIYNDLPENIEDYTIILINAILY